ncbi:hypothetical protein FSB78_05590 [Sphingomonas ginsenosidivorax]|uniref:DUF1440 domain-containing protein n=1 Tax=Sphingomonas ginsenosidivorax TaxID=862135 RepID=A0A5C6UCM2_9SPHN|nr:hypothetical protein [Sphingomonas ginsenosidivorax]TXC70473.1 hypothetical protein FSB78_05590 [Sphingomonas ginsenosidivorax]
MNGKHMTGAIAGALVAGLGLTVMMMAGERKSGKPSELTELERAGARELGVRFVPQDDRLPDATEQAIVQGGHLLLSAAAGAVYAASVDEDAGVVASGVAFGLAFYAAMHWITGPLLGLKKPEWQSDVGTIGMHTLNHVVFGLATAAGAKALAKR